MNIYLSSRIMNTKKLATMSQVAPDDTLLKLFRVISYSFANDHQLEGLFEKEWEGTSSQMC